MLITLCYNSSSIQTGVIAILLHKSNNLGKTPLHYAINYDMKEYVNLLTDDNIIDDAYVQGSIYSFFVVAAEFDNVNLMNKIISKHPIRRHISNAKDDKCRIGYTALYAAVSRAHVSATSFLLQQHDIDVNIWCDTGDTPLHISVSDLLYDTAEVHTVIRMLLQHPNINVNAQNVNGCTALHVAAEQSDMETIRLLLDHVDTDNTLQDSEGRTAGFIAYKRGCYEMANMINENEQTIM